MKHLILTIFGMSLLACQDYSSNAPFYLFANNGVPDAKSWELPEIEHLEFYGNENEFDSRSTTSFRIRSSEDYVGFYRSVLRFSVENSVKSLLPFDAAEFETCKILDRIEYDYVIFVDFECEHESGGKMTGDVIVNYPYEPQERTITDRLNVEGSVERNGMFPNIRDISDLSICDSDAPDRQCIGFDLSNLEEASFYGIFGPRINYE